MKTTATAKLIKTDEYRGERRYVTPCGRVEVDFNVKSHARRERDHHGRRVGGTIKITWYSMRAVGEIWSERAGSSLTEATAAAFAKAATLPVDAPRSERMAKVA